MYYRRSKNLFDPKSTEPFRLSRSKIENFIRCSRCFYLDRRLGVDQPQMPGFTLNIAVDHLLKKEFDIHRAKHMTHPLMRQYGIDAVPFHHEQINEWRENFVGLQHYHRPTNLIISGAVDDIWSDRDGQLMVVDYKATSINGEIKMDDEWKQSYKRQLEIYQWLLRQMGYKVSDVGYFVYANGQKDRAAFDGKLEFDVQIISHHGDASWVEPKIIAARKCLEGELPPHTNTCDHCAYRQAAASVEQSTPRSIATHVAAIPLLTKIKKKAAKKTSVANLFSPS